MSTRPTPARKVVLAVVIPLSPGFAQPNPPRRFDSEADGKADARVVGHRAQPRDQSVDGHGPLRVVHPPRLAGRGVNETADNTGADGRGGIDTEANGVLCRAIRSCSRRSRPSPMTGQADALRSVAARISATWAGSHSPGFSTPITRRSRPVTFTLSAIAAIAACIGGKT